MKLTLDFKRFLIGKQLKSFQP